MTDATETELATEKRAFWKAYRAADPGFEFGGTAADLKGPALLGRIPGRSFPLCFSIGRNFCRVYLRSRAVDDALGKDKAREFLAALHRRTGSRASLGDGKVCVNQCDAGHSNHDRWPELHDWMKDQRRLYIDAVTEILGPPQ